MTESPEVTAAKDLVSYLERVEALLSILHTVEKDGENYGMPSGPQDIPAATCVPGVWIPVGTWDRLIAAFEAV